ncbi:glycosyltransferase family 4 protein [Pedobacter sp. JCM 36344]|uniref:glycosyltransferase family 4 protein n=1 Tax=Pedobacter sp. JCM 36344 TaxID=3374280 RepID=UPI00397C126E
MRIALDCERMKYAHTGLFEYCLQLGNALKRLKASDDEISFYLNPSLQQYFETGDSFINQNSLQKFIFPKVNNIDVWHTTYQLSRYIPKSEKIKLVLTIHDLNFLHEEKSAAKVNKYLRKHQQNIDLCDHIVAISHFTKAEILQHLKVGDKPITVIYNGCAEPILTLDHKPNYIPDKPFLFALGTVNSKKNFHVLIPLLENNDYDLIIAGKPDPKYVDKILEEAKRLEVEDRVYVLGAITETDKYWYYQHCRAFLFPSIAEGFGIPPIEAMKFGKPVFLSTATSLPEIGGSAAYYFTNFKPTQMQEQFALGMSDYIQHQPADTIIRHAEQFNWSDSAKSYLEVYKTVLNG